VRSYFTQTKIHDLTIKDHHPPPPEKPPPPDDEPGGITELLMAVFRPLDRPLVLDLRSKLSHDPEYHTG